MSSIDKTSVLKKERKSRRTHKNSRDWCPNCKAKRIKCSEDLPACQNCIKKEYRCGYLDFPPERLEQIRLKNERKKQGRAFHDDMLAHDMMLDTNTASDKPALAGTNHFYMKKDSLRYQLYRDSFSRVVNPTQSRALFIQQPTADEFEGSKARFFGKGYFDRRDSYDLSFPLIAQGDPKPLPEAYIQKRLFKLMVREERLKNTFISLLYQKCGGDLKRMINDKFSFSYAPVWNSQKATSFWTTVYNQAVILDVYFSFFMDRSLNILLKSCNDHLSMGGDCASSTSTSPYNDSPTSSVASNSDACYNYEDLAVLTKKSYMIYGELIRNLRESLSRIHIEYLTKISLFAGWSSFLHVHASMETVSLIYTGTASLLSKICNDAESISDLTPTIRVAMDLVNLHLSFCLVPDYRFSVMNEIFDDLELFMDVFGISDRTGNDRDPICDRVTAYRLTGLHGFLKKLVNECYPNIQHINRSRNEGNHNLHFVQTNSLCELIVNWFRIFPSEVMGLSFKCGLMTKMFCLFYSATGKALQNVLTPIQSIWMVDMCNIICARSDMDPSLYAFKYPSTMGESQINAVTRIQARLMRIMSFFSYRTLFYSHVLSTTTVLDRKFTQPVLTSTSSPTGVLEILPSKMDIHEQFVSLFDMDTIINYENYPRLPYFAYDQEYQEVVRHSQLAQANSMHKPPQINFSPGLGVYDFDPRDLIQRFALQQENVWGSSSVSIEEWRKRMSCAEMSRREIATSGA